MKNKWTYLMAGAFVIALSTASFAGGGHGVHIKGEITAIDGEMVTVKDEHGEEHMLHVDKTTKKTGDLKAGAHVEANATKSGHTTMITVHDMKAGH